MKYIFIIAEALLWVSFLCRAEPKEAGTGTEGFAERLLAKPEAYLWLCVPGETHKERESIHFKKKKGMAPYP